MEHLDQSLSLKNARSVWDRDTRKGRSLPKHLTSRGATNVHLTSIFNNFELSHLLREERREKKKAATPAQMKLIDQGIKVAMARREELIEDFIASVHSTINANGFKIGVQLVPTNASLPATYALSDPYVENYFAEKLLQANVRRAFDVSTTSRDHIVERLVRVLDDTLPKRVIRGDVEKFYDSIPHGLLIETLKMNRALSTTSRIFVEQILRTVRGTIPVEEARGLPRGIGVSSPLSEVHLKAFDHAMQNIPEVIFYARYVDDFVLVVSAPTHTAPCNDYKSTITAELASIGLKLSEKSEKQYDQLFGTNRVLPSLTFLGYEISYSDGRVQVRMSVNRLEKILNRMEATFRAFEFSSIKSGTSAKRLTQRVRYLTSNTRLWNNKRSAFTGIYFSNRYLTEFDQIASLDAALNAHIAAITDAKLRARLSGYTFDAGFNQRQFVRWRTKEMDAITSLWTRRG